MWFSGLAKRISKKYMRCVLTFQVCHRGRGVSSLSLSFGDGSSKKTEVIAEPRNEIVIDESVGLKLRPDYSVRTSLKRDEVTARQMVSIETRVDELRGWTWHLFYHRSLLNLLTISDWVPRTFANLEVLRNEDSYELDGKKERYGTLFCHICRESTVPTLRILSLSISFAFLISVKKEFGNGLN